MVKNLESKKTSYKIRMEGVVCTSTILPYATAEYIYHICQRSVNFAYSPTLATLHIYEPCWYGTLSFPGQLVQITETRTVYIRRKTAVSGCVNTFYRYTT